jgi:hypothetical protein
MRDGVTKEQLAFKQQKELIIKGQKLQQLKCTKAAVAKTPPTPTASATYSPPESRERRYSTAKSTPWLQWSCSNRRIAAVPIDSDFRPKYKGNGQNSA